MRPGLGHAESDAARDDGARAYGPLSSGSADNPFANAWLYVNPHYRANALASAARVREAELAQAMRTVAELPTAVWLDRIAAIEPEEGPGLRDHLDGALAQWRDVGLSGAMALTVVVYNLPGRDCAAHASNGELAVGELARYQTEFIDPIVQILGQRKYADLRVVVVLEPDSLPNLVTNRHVAACAESDTEYRTAITYAIQALARVPNVHTYLDIGHGGWLGWGHAEPAAAIYRSVIDAAGGPDQIRGFATNVSGYSPLRETFDPFRDPGLHERIVKAFYEWNQVIDEERFVTALRTALGPDYEGAGFIVDTSRNGWRPRSEAPSDGRTHRGNWCNVSGAGIGRRPAIDTDVPGIDAYVFVKPPGESDGISDANAATSVEGKKYDPQCGPDERIDRGAVGRLPTNALRNAPHAGQWFHDQFEMLVRNAHPPLLRQARK